MAVVVFNDWTDIKPFLSGSHSTNDLETIESQLSSALNDEILPYLGQAAYAGLLDAFEADSSDTRDKKAIGYLRGALANLAYFILAKEGALQITDLGLQQTTTAETKAPYQWQVNNFKKQKFEAGTNYLGQLLVYLESNYAYFTAWAGSDQRTEYRKFFIRDLVVFNRYRRIADFGTLLALWPYMRRIQADGFSSSITSELYAIICSEYTGTISTDIALLIPYVQEVIAHQSLYNAIYELNFVISAEGFRLATWKNDSNNSREERAALDEIGRAKTYLLQAADGAMSRLIRYLDENASAEKYAPYYNNIVVPRANAGNEIDNLRTSLTTGPSFVL